MQSFSTIPISMIEENGRKEESHRRTPLIPKFLKISISNTPFTLPM